MMRFGYDIGGTNIAAGILDENNNLIAKGSVRFPRGCGNDAVIDACTELYRSIVAQAGIAPEDIVGVGVAVPGSVDPKNGIVIDAHNLGFHHTPLREMLSAKTEKPVYLINDADAATLAEHRICYDRNRDRRRIDPERRTVLRRTRQRNGTRSYDSLQRRKALHMWD